MGENHDSEQELRRALDGLEAAYEQASATIEAMRDPLDAYVQASALRELVDGVLVGRASSLRARMAERVKDADDLSRAALAERIGTSKSRADQLIREAANPRRRMGILTGWFAESSGVTEYLVAICGSRAPQANAQVINETIRTLGTFLTRFHCRVIHGPMGVGIETMTHIADHYRPPDLGEVAGIFGRPNLMRDADYVLVIGGGHGTEIEVDLAISMEKKLIPMPTSGGTAAKTYARLQRNQALRRWMPSETFTALATADADEFTQVVEKALSVEPDNDTGAIDD